jgi:hypothetical protein
MTLQQRVQEVVNRAASEIARAVRQNIAEQVARMTGGAKAAAKPAKEKPVKRRRGRRGRRGPNSAGVEKVLKFVQSHPGLRSEQIQKQMDLASARVKGALLKLRATGKVKTKGQKRATTYQAA